MKCAPPSRNHLGIVLVLFYEFALGTEADHDPTECPIRLRNRAAVAEELRRLLPRMERIFVPPGPFPSVFPSSTATCPRAGSPAAPCMRSCPERRRNAGRVRLHRGAAYSPIDPCHLFPSPLWGGGVGVGRLYLRQDCAPLYERAQPPDPPPYPPPQGGREGKRVPLFFVMPPTGSALTAGCMVMASALSASIRAR